MSALKVVHVEPLAPSGVIIGLSNGKQFSVDLGSYLAAPGYERLHDLDLFKSVQVEEWGHGIEWQAIDMGIDVDSLNRLAREQSGTAFPVQSFNAWMQKNGLSLTTAAQALGLTRRTVIYYHCGHKPIPLYIGLACDGWEARKKCAGKVPRKKNLPSRIIRQTAVC
jgi:hypothetical protein